MSGGDNNDLGGGRSLGGERAEPQVADTVRDLLRRAAQAGPPVEQPTGSSGTFAGGGHTQEETPVRRIVFWRDGFQLEDGELRRYDNPEQARILAEFNARHTPPSVLNVRPGQLVELRVIKRTDEDYVPPETAEK